MSGRIKLAGLLLTATLTLAGAGAHAEKATDTLRVVWRDAIPNVDPYYNTLRTGLIFQQHTMDGLVYRDPDSFEIKPLLATAWAWVDDRTLDLTLRQGVTFHNGDKFSADDVVYTLNLVLSPEAKVSVPSNYSWIDKAEKIDDYHVRVHLKKITPPALEFFAMITPIYPKAYREKVGPEGFSKAPVGAGPYKVTRVDGVNQIDMVRFDGYYADSPKGKPKIGKLVIREVADAATEMAELLSGRADWIWNFNPDQFEQVGRMPNLQALRAESMRLDFLQLDAAGRSGAGNPLTNVKVRQAILHAIDRQTFAKQLVQGGSRPLDAPCYPSQVGCDQSAAVKYDYDPAKAKQLLAEAGYPNGFETELVGYFLDSWMASIQGYLGAVGIKAKVSRLQVGAVTQRNEKGDTPLTVGSWGSNSINDVAAVFPVYYDGKSLFDFARDPEAAKLVEEGGTTNDLEARKRAYSALIKRVTEQAYWTVLATDAKYYGLSKQLEFRPDRDELPRFFNASWK
jgi:peptide/nickel transport system substrate-binding protein